MNLNRHMHEGLKRSLKILRAVKLPKCAEHDIQIGTYANGRENGLCVRVYTPGPKYNVKVFVFAENRNSDSMVLYSGGERDFTINNGLTDAVYKRKEFFSSDEALTAALQERITAQLAFKEVA